MPVLEVKTLPLANVGLEIKSDDGGAVRVSGYGSTFGGPPDSYGDLIAPGAYSKTIREWSARSWPLPMLFNHDPDKIVGRWDSMSEDAIGLKVEGSLIPGHSLANDIGAALRHGALSGLSIGFRTKKANDGPDGTRVLEDIELFEISAVTSPANERARVVGVKSDAVDIETLRDFEVLLRSHGWSRREAEAIAAKGFKTFLSARDEQGGNDGDDVEAAAAAELARKAEEEARIAEAAAKAAVKAAEERRDGERRAAEWAAFMRKALDDALSVTRTS